MRNYFKSGSWNALCDVCGFKFKAEQLSLRWDGRRVCKEDFETRHPSDLLRVPKEDTTVDWSVPDNSVMGYVCNFVNSQAIAGIAVAGCVRAGSKLP